MYIIGPNASGKSNLLDIFRFMRDIVNPQGGGLQQAISSRGGMKKIRCLAARRFKGIELEFHFQIESTESKEHPKWKYILSFQNEGTGKQRPIVRKEEIYRDSQRILKRPNEMDKEDKERLTQTHLEQINENKGFRDIADFFKKVLYLHLVPQLIKFSDQLSLMHMESDPFGQGLLEEIAGTPKKTRDSRLKKIETILIKVIPNLKELVFKKDETNGRPHLEMRYDHWRPKAGLQREDQFSDGTLRLIATIWTLLTSNRMILLEEPELSLHTKIVEQIPDLIYKTRQSKKKSDRGQILISTHSEAMLSSQSIEGDFLILKPGVGGEATTIEMPTEAEKEFMKSGFTPAEILLQKSASTIEKI